MRFCKGFTLIEVIITIVVMAIAAVTFITYLGKGLISSGVPSSEVQSQYVLIRQMEVFTSQYRNQVTTNSSFTLTTFKSTYIDGKPYVDSSKTGLITLTSGTYTTQNVLRVTLTDRTQSLSAIFTQ